MHHRGDDNPMYLVLYVSPYEYCSECAQFSYSFIVKKDMKKPHLDTIALQRNNSGCKGLADVIAFRSVSLQDGRPPTYNSCPIAKEQNPKIHLDYFDLIFSSNLYKFGMGKQCNNTMR
jgi:hypothetical protein